MADKLPERVVAKPIHPPGSGKKLSRRQLWASVCYYYPQYTLEEASRLSVRDIRLLLNTARRLEAQQNYNLVQIVASPHTKKGKGVQELTRHFRKEMST